MYPDTVINLVRLLSPEDLATVYYIILTIYQIFYIQILCFEKILVPTSKGKRKGWAVREKSVEEDNQDLSDTDNNNNKNQELSEEQLYCLKSILLNIFRIIIVDKFYKLKSVQTRTYQAVLLALPTNIFLILAIPTINWSADLYSILSLIWQYLRPSLVDRIIFDYNNPLYISLEQFNNTVENFDKLTTVNLIDIQYYLIFLYPATFQSIANKEHQLSTSVAAQTLLLILSLIQLYRVKGKEIDILGTNVVIGSNILLYKVTTVELEISLDKYKKYLVIYKQLAGKLAIGRQEGEREGRATEEIINIVVYRLLGYIYIYPRLDIFCKNKKATTAKVVI
jgi:hypothetical protein